MRTEVWTIDPPRAAELLSTMVRNRPVSTAVVDRYARAMTAGRWRLNGASVSVVMNGDGTPHLINGAHRMQAVIRSGVTQEFLVAFEDDEEVFSTFDVGRNRTTATLLALGGQTNSVVVGGICRVVLLYAKAPHVPWNSTKSTLVTQDEVLAWHHDRGPEGQEALSAAARYYGEVQRSLRQVGAWYGALAWLIQDRSEQPELFLAFHEAVRHGADLPAGDPRLAFRNYIVNHPMLRGGSAEGSRQSALTVGISAWNEWLAGERREYYRPRTGRAATLPMPKVR